MDQLDGSAQLPSRIDPLAEELGGAKEEVGDGGDQAGYVHVRVQQRNGRKSLTTVSLCCVTLAFLALRVWACAVAGGEREEGRGREHGKRQPL